MSEEAEIFKEEAYELLDEVETSLLQLQSTPDDNELINKLFRDLHTIKGSGAMFGFDKVAEFTHKLEDVIDLVRKGSIEFSTDLVDPFLAGRDIIIRMVEDPDFETIESDAQTAEIVDAINTILSPPSEEGSVKRTTPLKILIVEDEFSSRFILQDFLLNYGTTHVAIDGFEAVLAIKKALTEGKPYDLICLDIKMPGLDGRKVSDEVRRLEAETGDGKNCHIVMTSSVDDKDLIGQMLANKQCDLYLVKPVSIVELSKYIEKIN